MSFTDKMSIEVGGTMGTTYVWRDNAERWHHDCVGAKKKQGPTVMFLFFVFNQFIFFAVPELCS